jgi:hypothetical protein
MEIGIQRDIFEQARETVISVKAQWQNVEAQKQALPPVDKALDGQMAVEARARELKEAEETQQRISEQGLTTIQELSDRFMAELTNKSAPRGEDLENPDYILIRDGLIDNPEELKAIVARHDNIAFVRAAQSYAEEHGWPGYDVELFALMRTVCNLSNFSMTFFDLCEIAVKNPLDVAAKLVSDESEINRMATAYGVLEYLK